MSRSSAPFVKLMPVTSARSLAMSLVLIELPGQYCGCLRVTSHDWPNMVASDWETENIAWETVINSGFARYTPTYSLYHPVRCDVGQIENILWPLFEALLAVADPAMGGRGGRPPPIDQKLWLVMAARLRQGGKFSLKSLIFGHFFA